MLIYGVFSFFFFFFLNNEKEEKFKILNDDTRKEGSSGILINEKEKFKSAFMKKERRFSKKKKKKERKGEQTNATFSFFFSFPLLIKGFDFLSRSKVYFFFIPLTFRPQFCRERSSFFFDPSEFSTFFIFVFSSHLDWFLFSLLCNIPFYPSFVFFFF